MTITTLSVRAARRLALARSGFLKPDWTDLPTSAGRGAAAARRAAHRIIDRFGYLQLDTVSVAGARSHAIVLLSRLDRFDPDLGEQLLQPGEPLFEYWGHEVCWLPMSMYPDMGWRRERFRHHPWWGDVIGRNPDLARDIMSRVRNDGPLKSSDLEGPSGKGWWNHKPAKNVAVALWTAGDLVVRERKGFQRTFDLPERVIPADIRERPELTLADALPRLLLRAIDGHGWAQTGTLAQSWRLRNLKSEIQAAL
ncbi:MAG TPA: crosslink repair DNA glycosylase YcaQ family protein, partial [Candidatus Eisenbacteria bacterium]